MLPSEKELIFNLLKRHELVPNDLNFLKDWSPDTKFKLPIVLEILHNPLHFPVLLDSIRSVSKKVDENQLLELFAELIFQEKNLPVPPESYQKSAKNIRQEKDIFAYVETVWQDVEAEFTQAFALLDESEWEKITYFAYTVYSEKEDSLAYRQFFETEKIKLYDNLTLADYLPILEKINFSALIKSAFMFQTGFTILQDKVSKMTFSGQKRIEKKTRWGTFCIGTKNNDIYSQNYSFLLEPGGNDSYRGTIRTSRVNPFYWFWDLAGEDTYQNVSLGGLFSVFFGLGIHEDSSGSDYYFGNDYTFSAIFGYQQHKDKEGNDTYQTGLHSLAASSFGISFLINERGNDFYSATQSGEGFGGTLGSGLLLDTAGNDVYFTGGKYLHAPLVPADYRSLGQGFGFGLRPDFAGGIGVLCDLDGNDYYNGGVYAQGTGYWYALGIVIDESGNDFYNAVYYPQGSGIHLAGGFLYDGGGEDHYYSKHGPGQGAGHDYAVGFLIDRNGNDVYSIDGGNGLGLTNSVGIFLDAGGNDRYERHFSSNYGFANQARDAGGIGIFLDLDGDDFYPLEYTKNNDSWLRGTYGIGIDTLFFQQTKTISEVVLEDFNVEIDSSASIDVVFSIASEWAVGANQKRVEKAREILMTREEETADYIFREQLGTKSGLTYRAIEHFASRSEFFKPMLKKALHHTDSLCVKNAISLLAEMKDDSILENLQFFLSQNRYLPTVLSALGSFASDASVSLLKEYMYSDSERIRFITARSLKKINTQESLQYLQQMKNDSSFLLKSMTRIWESQHGTE
jgi:hypothetical protein